ncbi:hypothetical protein AVEN_148305-1 [Araneus ventricosus]|uniref:Uncharacterized protein n=1 Tax=Araneus ventricosus TaxID=182803 RepID=A0A4Y2WDI9_ARAVE|nr:hypothetical protein AVEN_148305-1 [Araneus ventricosus]
MCECYHDNLKTKQDRRIKIGMMSLDEISLLAPDAPKYCYDIFTIVCGTQNIEQHRGGIVHHLAQRGLPIFINFGSNSSTARLPSHLSVYKRNRELARRMKFSV